MPSKPRRQDGPMFTSAAGHLVWPKLSEIDFGSKEYPNPDGSYSTGLSLQQDDPLAQAMIAALKPLHEQAIVNAERKFAALKPETRKKLKEVKVNPLYTERLDPETEEPTGEIVFKFSMKASGKYKPESKRAGRYWDSRPSVFDGSRGNVPLIEGFSFKLRDEDATVLDVHKAQKPEVGGGSLAKISFEVSLDDNNEPGYFVNGTGAAGLSLKLRAVQVLELRSGNAKTAADFGFGDETPAFDQAVAAAAAADTGPDF